MSDNRPKDQGASAEYLWQRDQCRAKCVILERENIRLSMLLRYAQEAMQEEYLLRVRTWLTR